MLETDLTLTHLFAVKDSEFVKRARAALESSVAIASLREVLANRARLLQWPWVFQQVRMKLPDLFDVNVIEVMLLAWKKYLLLARYADQRTYPPDDVILVPLVEHSFQYRQRPYLQIMVGEQEAGKIEFDVTFSLKLKAFIVKIHNARIEAIQTGICEGKGSIGLENVVLAEKVFGSIKLPGSIDLAEGIALAA